LYSYSSFEGTQKIYDIDCGIKEEFLWGSRFKNPSRSYIKYFTEGFDLHFNSEVYGIHGDRPKAKYRTRFGPYFVNSSVVYGNFSSGINKAVRRVTCAREPENPGREQELQEKQHINVPRLRYVRKWKRVLANRCRENFLNRPSPEDWRKEWAEAPHPKRRLRMEAMRQLDASNKSWHHTWIEKVKYKMKLLERAKPGKKPRAIGDLGVLASAKFGYGMSEMKHLFSEPIILGNMRLRYCESPKKDAIRVIFNDLISSPYTEYVFYSDDACIAHTDQAGRRVLANLDISSCDGSNYERIFDLMKSVMLEAHEYAEDIIGTFDQLLSIIRIDNPSSRPGTKSERVYLKTMQRTLFSGSTLTTMTNNVANSVIAMSVYEHLLKGLSIREAVSVGAEFVGFKVTFEEQKTYHGLQFLKHSPFMGENGIEVNLNLGVLFRTFGECDGDLPGKSKVKIEERAERFLSELVRSHKHSGENPVMEAFRRKFVRKASYNYFSTGCKSVEAVHLDSAAPDLVSGDELVARYGCTLVDLEDFCSYVARSKIGDYIKHHFVDVVLKVDYGL